MLILGVKNCQHLHITKKKDEVLSFVGFLEKDVEFQPTYNILHIRKGGFPTQTYTGNMTAAIYKMPICIHKQSNFKKQSCISFKQINVHFKNHSVKSQW